MIFWNDILKMWWYNLDITDVTLASDDQSIKLTRWSSRLVAPNLKTLVLVYIREKKELLEPVAKFDIDPKIVIACVEDDRVDCALIIGSL